MSEGKTWVDLVRDYFPDEDDKTCDCILWNLTAFPMGGLEIVKKQLEHAKEIGLAATQKEADDEMETFLNRDRTKDNQEDADDRA